MKVVYRLDQERDMRLAFDSLAQSRDGIFWEQILKICPQLIGVPRDQLPCYQSHLETSLNTYYSTHVTTLERKRQEFSAIWGNVETQFFARILALFGYRIQPGHYVGYLSIFDQPRPWSEDNNFQIFWEYPHGPLCLTARALVRFLFLDHIKHWYPDTLGKLPIDRGLVWQLTELFIDIVFRTPAFLIVYDRLEFHLDPEVKSFCEQAHSLWKKGQGIDHWLENMAFVLGKSTLREF